MKIKDIEATKKGDFIEHNRYGLCIVYENNFSPFGQWFGLALRPLSIVGFQILLHDSGCLFNTVLEHRKRPLLRKIESPKIPKLIFQKKENIFEVHEWNELGKVDRQGNFSSKLLKEFPTLEEALKFADE